MVNLFSLLFPTIRIFLSGIRQNNKNSINLKIFLKLKY